MIPAEAVEAAAKATFQHANIGAPWDGAAPDWKDAYRAAVLAGLEAAAPYIRAQAWEEGASAGLGWDENRGEDFATPNPYRLNNEGKK